MIAENSLNLSNGNSLCAGVVAAACSAGLAGTAAWLSGVYGVGSDGA